MHSTIDENVTIRQEKVHIPHTVIYLLIPVQGVGIVAFIVYLIFHFQAFIDQSTSIAAWILYFCALGLYVGLGVLIVKVTKSGIDAFIALGKGLTEIALSIGNGIADIRRKEAETKHIQASTMLLHTAENYVVHKEGDKIVVTPIAQYNPRVQVTEQVQGNQNLLAPVDYVPEPYKFSDVLQRWEPSKDGILLAKKHDLITVPLGEDLCHTIFTGNTDAGKTNDERLLLIQLLYLNQCVYLCDRNFQSYRADKKLGCVYDYTPIEKLLACEPVTDAKGVLALLKALYHEELEERRIRRRKALVSFKDIYITIDELPAFCGDEPEIMDYVGRFLRESRQYGMFFIGAAQDLLNGTLNNDNGAVRENLLTNYYGGGDFNTARMTLNLQKGEKINEEGLGRKGLKYLRAKGASIEHDRVRVAYGDDNATHLLLADKAHSSTRETLPFTYEDTSVESKSTEVIPIRKESNKPSVQDAIEVWNAYSGVIGSPTLVKELTAKGFECTDYLARRLLEEISRMCE